MTLLHKEEDFFKPSERGRERKSESKKEKRGKEKERVTKHASKHCLPKSLLLFKSFPSTPLESSQLTSQNVLH